MRRRILIWAAAAALALPFGEAALAKGDHGDGQGRGGGRGRAEHQGPPRRDEAPRGEMRRPEPRGYERSYEPRRAEPRYEPRYEPRRDDRRPPMRGFREDQGGPRGGRWDDERRYEDAPPPVRAPQRGGYLPDRFRGGVVEDYPRYRLRTPPRGYAWVRVGNGFALVSLDDGRIFDMVQ